MKLVYIEKTNTSFYNTFMLKILFLKKKTTKFNPPNHKFGLPKKILLKIPS